MLSGTILLHSLNHFTVASPILSISLPLKTNSAIIGIEKSFENFYSEIMQSFSPYVALCITVFCVALNILLYLYTCCTTSDI